MQMQRKKPQVLRQLTNEWYQKLKNTGFLDIEDKYQRLWQYDRRTQSFEDREIILDFFLRLDTYLNEANLKILHRKILELYTQGMRINDIARYVGRTQVTVNRIIRIHKNIILGRS